MFSAHNKIGALAIGAIISLVLNVAAMSFSFAVTPTDQKRQITLTAMLEDQGDPTRWNSLIIPALQELRTRHPDKDIQLNYTTFPYAQARLQILKALTNQTPTDLVSVDQIWLGEFAQKGLLTDLTNRTQIWGDLLNGIKQTGMVVSTMVMFMEYGHGPMSGVFGIGRIYWVKRALILIP